MFSKKAEYALRAAIYIAQMGDESRKLSIGEISKAIDAPSPFTAKILQQLTRGNKLVSSVRGPNGGFFMKADAKRSSILKVLELVKEDQLLNKCILGLKECSETKPCPMHFQYSPIKKQLIHLFETKSIQELAEELSGKDIVLSLKTRFKSRS